MKKNDLLTILTGFMMALADSVPGVSGGTIAYILGKYEELIQSINDITSKTTSVAKRSALIFLVKLMSGWIVGFIFAILVITAVIHDYIYQLSSLFIGFIVFSIPFIIKEEFKILRSNLKYIIFTLLSTTIVVSISYFSSTSISLVGDNLSLLSYIYIFVAGVIAISAMLLPGISGSTLLIIFGLYIPVVTAVKDVLKFDFSGLLICITFGIGILVGLKFTSKLIETLLERHRAKVIYAILGLMLGSLYSIYIGPTTLVDEVTDINLGLAPLALSTFSILYFLIGVFVIASLDYLRSRLEVNKK